MTVVSLFSFDVKRSRMSEADRADFERLSQQLRDAVGAVSAVEAEITRAAQVRAHCASSLALWTSALRAGREPEIVQLRSVGEAALVGLQDLAQRLGYRNAEHLARNCGLPSPTRFARAA